MRYALLLTLLAACAHAEDVVGLHGPSTHFRSGPNNDTYGVYLRREQIEVGTFYNSRRNATVYAGYLLESDLPLRPALLLGGATGYGRPVTPFATASISYPMTPDWRVRVEYAKDFSAHYPGALHLRVERKF